MRLFKSSLLTFILSSPLLLINTSIASPTDYHKHDKQQQSLPFLPLPVKIIHEFPRGTWVENLAVRSNGLILANLLSAPEIYQVNPTTGAASLATKIPAATGLLGIAETEKDVYYVVAGNYSVATLTAKAGTFSVWRVDVDTFKPNETLAKVEKVVDLPQAQFLNGATVLSRREGTLLIADSALGGVFRVNTRSKEVKLVIKDPLFGITPASPVELGLNGLSYRGGELFFTNTNQGLLGKILIQPDGTPKAKAEVLSRGVALVDDFAVGGKGGYFVTQDVPNQLSFVPPGGGNASVLVGANDRPGLKGPTSAAIGKGKRKVGRGSLYIGTNGGALNYLSGNFTVGGTISRVDIEKFY